jgi:hypothetical protein
MSMTAMRAFQRSHAGRRNGGGLPRSLPIGACVEASVGQRTRRKGVAITRNH